MTDTEFREWLLRRDACEEAIAWAEGLAPQEAWKTCPRADWMMWGLNELDYADDRELRLYACWCVRLVWDRLTDPRSRAAVDVVERYARGEATADEELRVACNAAWIAADDTDKAVKAGWTDARAADRAAANAAAEAATISPYAAKSEVAAYAAKSAAEVAAYAAEAAGDVFKQNARLAQADELRRRIPWSVIEPLFAAALAKA